MEHVYSDGNIAGAFLTDHRLLVFQPAVVTDSPLKYPGIILGFLILV